MLKCPPQCACVCVFGVGGSRRALLCRVGAGPGRASCPPYRGASRRVRSLGVGVGRRRGRGDQTGEDSCSGAQHVRRVLTFIAHSVAVAFAERTQACRANPFGRYALGGCLLHSCDARLQPESISRVRLNPNRSVNNIQPKVNHAHSLHASYRSIRSI